MDLFFGEKSSESAKKTYIDGDIVNIKKEFTLGEWNTFHYLSDPKRMAFIFSRYKFVAKMFEGLSRVFEIGCQEGLGSLVVAKSVGHLTATDFYKPHIETCLKMASDFQLNIDFRGHDIIDGPIQENFDGAFSLDVFEHIDPSQEMIFMQNIAASLSKTGVFILGTPSLESQKYASEGSKIGHINCKSGGELRSICRQYYQNVFMFGMNDEVVHTGFLPMAHYLLALCVGPKDRMI